MLSSRPPLISLPPSTLAIKPQVNETAPGLPKLRIEVQPRGLVVNSPSLSPRPDTKAIAHALKVFVPLNGYVHIKISLDLRSLGDNQPVRLRDDALQMLDGCLRDNASKLGLERITRCPEPRVFMSEEDDVDLHYRILPKAALPEHNWFKDQAVASQEPYIDLKEMRLRMSWTNSPNGVPGEGSAIDNTGSYLDMLHRQLRGGMRRVLRLQFIQFPLVFDDPFIPHYKSTLKTPADLIHSLRSFVSLAARYDTPLLAATRDLLDDIEETQDSMMRRQVEATVKVTPKRGPKKRKADGGSIAEPDDDGHMDIVANHLRRLSRRDDALAESSISRALITIGISEWSCVRRGRSRAGAGRIILENTPVPNIHPYDDIRNHTGASRVPSPLHDNKYKPALTPDHTFSSPCQTYLYHPSEQDDFGMCEPQRNTTPFSYLPPLRPVSRAALPPPTPRPKCVALPICDDDLDFEYDSPEAECASSMGRIYLDDWSSPFSSHDETGELNTELSAVEIEIETLSTTNALWLDLCSESSTSAFDSNSDCFSDSGNGPRPPCAAAAVSSPIQSSRPTQASRLGDLGDSDLSDDLSQVTIDFEAPEASRRRRGGSNVPRVMSSPTISVSSEYTVQWPFMTAPTYPAPLQRSLSDGHLTDEWASDWDVDMLPAPFEDDLGDGSDTERDEMSPPDLDEDSDLESDGPSLDSPQESGVLMSGVDPQSKHQGPEPSQFTQIVDDLDFNDEVLVTPMEEDVPFALTSVPS